MLNGAVNEWVQLSLSERVLKNQVWSESACAYVVKKENKWCEI